MEPEKKTIFESLASTINQARDEGNIELLREIADDPNGFMLRQGWGALDLTEEVEIKALRKLYVSLQLEIVNLLEMLNRLHESQIRAYDAQREKIPGWLRKSPRSEEGDRR